MSVACGEAQKVRVRFEQAVEHFVHEVARIVDEFFHRSASGCRVYRVI
jgi:hypothetical protein